MQLSRELSRWRKQLAHQQMLLFGVLGLLAGTAGGDLAKTLSHCLDAGRELLRQEVALRGDLAENSRPGSGFCGGCPRDMAMGNILMNS